MSEKLREPLYEHDCDQCVFLGVFMSADLWVHAEDETRKSTVIARYGKHGDYNSGLCFSYGTDPRLTEARIRAEARDLLKLGEGVTKAMVEAYNAKSC